MRRPIDLPGTSGTAIALAKQAEASARKVRREELAKALLLKIVENTGGVHPFDVSTNVRAAIAYTDQLLEALEKNDEPTDQ